MLNRRTLALAAAGTALTGRAVLAQSANLPPSSDLRGMSPEILRAAALQGGAFLMQTAQLAVDKPTRAAVKRFGTFEVAEQQGILQAMRLAGYPVAPPPLLPPQTVLIERLGSAGEATFEQLFVEAQLSGHSDALNVYTAIAESGSAPVADRVAAVLASGHIREHLTVLQSLLSA